MPLILSWYAAALAFNCASITMISPKTIAKRSAPTSITTDATLCWKSEPWNDHGSPSSIASVTYIRHA